MFLTYKHVKDIEFMKEHKKTTAAEDQKAERDYPGIAVDHSDHEEVDPALVKERNKTLGFNPRNTK